MSSKHGVFSLISLPSPLYCRSGGSMMRTAVATYQPRSSRWGKLRSKPDRLKDKPSVGSRSRILVCTMTRNIKHKCLLTAKPNSSEKLRLNINVKSFPFQQRCSFWSFVYAFQAFLGDLFQQHHKDVSADKLEEYTDTMVALYSNVVLCLWTFVWQTLSSLLRINPAA